MGFTDLLGLIVLVGGLLVELLILGGIAIRLDENEKGIKHVERKVKKPRVTRNLIRR